MKLSTPKSTWKKMFFMGNTSKMRKALMNYLSEEGLKNELIDGIVHFEYNDIPYETMFDTYDDWAECIVSFKYASEEYETFDGKDKTFIGDKMNMMEENHTTTIAYADAVSIETRFYFSNERMLLTLFAEHMNELSEAVNDFCELLCKIIDEKKGNEQPNTIGFLGNKAIAAKEQ